MPGLGDPLVRQMRRLAQAHAAFPGRPPKDREELLRWYESERAREPNETGASGISRREFLQRGAAVGAGAVGASALGLGRPRPAFAKRDANVVIVGAGLGGLTCAYRLMRHGISSTVYESRDRVGGRCWTIRVFENAQTVEHGGQYLDSRHHHIRKLAKELRVPLVDTEAQSFPAGSGDYYWFDGAFHTPDEIFADFDLVFDRIRADYRRVGRYFYNQAKAEAIAFDQMTMNEWLDDNVPGGLDSLLGQAIERSNTGFWGLDGDQLSAVNLFEFYVFPYPGADERFRVAGGNDVIPHRLAEELPSGTIRYERPLEAAWTRSDGKIGLKFAGQAGDVVADVAVFALPFTVLRDLDTSGLNVSARRRRAIDTLAMGTNAKLQFQLNRTLADVDWTGAFRSDEPGVRDLGQHLRAIGAASGDAGDHDLQRRTRRGRIRPRGAACHRDSRDHQHGPRCARSRRRRHPRRLQRDRLPRLVGRRPLGPRLVCRLRARPVHGLLGLPRAA